jgi:TRAP transporter T-component
LDSGHKHPAITVKCAGATFWVWIPLLLMFLLPTACALQKKMTVISAAALLEDVAQATAKQSDLRVIREGTPAYLMLFDGLAEGWPDNDRLLLAAAQTYSAFASVFIAEDDTAFRNVLLGRSRHYALRALEERGIANPLTSPFDAFEAAVQRMARDDLPYLFWAGSCWAGWISMNRNSIEAIAELPRVEALMRRSLALDERYHYGGPHLFMGIWYASRPAVAGGNLQRAREHFARAMDIGQGKFLMTYIYYADVYCRNALDRDQFTSTLQTVLSTRADIVPELTLVNTVARRKAENMLARTDEYF